MMTSSRHLPASYVWKEKDKKSRFFKMWRVECFGCDKIWQYYSFGAALGSVQEHHRRRCNGS